MASLKIIKGTNQGTDLPLDGDNILLGRNAECQIVINLPAVSREHAVIKRVQNQFWIEDLKSRNKTYVNEVEVKPAKSVLLKHSDKIKICDNVFEFLDKRPLTDLFPNADADDAAPEEESSSTVEAPLSHSSKQILETQPAEKLAILLNIVGELTQTF